MTKEQEIGLVGTSDAFNHQDPKKSRRNRIGFDGKYSEHVESSKKWKTPL